MLSKKVDFVAAVPVWGQGLEQEMNVSILFRLEPVAAGGSYRLRLAASSAYQIFINGEFYAMGPARAGHGYYRVDEYEITEALRQESNTVDILVAGYNNNSFYWIDVPPFLAAELLRDGAVEACTAPSGSAFCGYRYAERVQKVQRYSFQRNFAEVYDYRQGRTDFSAPLPLVRADAAEKIFIERGIFYPRYEREEAKSVICTGQVSVSEKPQYFMDRAITQIGPKLKGFPMEELTVCSAWEAQKLDFTPKEKSVRRLAAASGGPAENRIPLEDNAYAVLDMGRNMSGLIGLTVRCEKETVLYVLFDEILGGGDPDRVDFLRLGTSSVVMWRLPAGTYKLLTFEPYVFRYLKIVAACGGAVVSDVHLRRVGFPMPEKRTVTDNPKIRAVFDAAVETFRQNTCDIFMDCASRERGGWLCDSFFTARAEKTLTGRSEVERNFLENFLQPASFACLPEGMLPMCYPGDHYDGVFIPNWAMWYVIELEEYFIRTGDRELIGAARERVYALLRYFRRFENGDGLLEKLESWIFVEWSRSNELVQDVNFPTNMLYVRMKRAMAALYGDRALAEEADALAGKIKELSFNGTFFCDNLVYRDGVAVPSGECTESCQYYAFHTGVATREEYPALWETLLHSFGPQRKQHNPYPEVAFSNAFIGNYLRLDLLMRFGYEQEVLENIEGYLYYMAEKTGTLWENDGDYASCSHGFASHVVCWLDRLGLLA